MEELTQWFSNMFEQGTLLPKIFTGINIYGAQYILIMSDIDIAVGKHHQFTRYVLHHEQ